MSMAIAPPTRIRSVHAPPDGSGAHVSSTPATSVPPRSTPALGPMCGLLGILSGTWPRSSKQSSLFRLERGPWAPQTTGLGGSPMAVPWRRLGFRQTCTCAPRGPVTEQPYAVALWINHIQHLNILRYTVAVLTPRLHIT